MTASAARLPGACDCHVHLIGPAARYPFSPDRVYTPGEASEAELDALHARIGLSRVVVVQPSVYGTDNRRTLDGVKALGARARAIVVIDAATSEDDLEAMHRGGARGLRVNIATHGMNDPETAWRLISDNARRAARIGWHVQVLTRLPVIAALAPRFADLPVPLVVDHFGLPDPAQGVGQPGFAALLGLVERGAAIVKLSAIERLTGAGRGAAMAPFIKALVEANADAVVWGSDWPHTGGGRQAGRAIEAVEPFETLDDADALAVLRGAVTDEGVLRRILVETPARLYDFPNGDVA